MLILSFTLFVISFPTFFSLLFVFFVAKHHLIINKSLIKQMLNLPKATDSLQWFLHSKALRTSSLQTEIKLKTNNFSLSLVQFSPSIHLQQHILFNQIKTDSRPTVNKTNGFLTLPLSSSEAVMAVHVSQRDSRKPHLSQLCLGPVGFGRITNSSGSRGNSAQQMVR